MSAKVTLHTNHPVEKVLPQRNSVASEQYSPEISVEKVLREDNTCCVGATLEDQNPLPVENVQPFQREGFSDFEFSTECTRSVLKQTNKQTDWF